MKSRSILSFCLTAILFVALPFSPLSAQGTSHQGINYMDYKTCSISDVLKKAAAEKKYIFVDIWTPWCGVCKMMDRYIFPRKDVGELFNAKFVNITFDAEHPKWASVARNFNATSYPTMLILNPQGEVVWNIDNLGVPQEEDLKAPKSAVADRLMTQASLAEKQVTMPDSAFVDKENWSYLFHQGPGFDTKVFQRMIQLKDTLLKLYPKEFQRAVDSALGSAVVNMFYSVNHKPVLNEHKMAQYRDVVEKLDFPEKRSMLLELELTVSLQQKQWESVLSTVAQSESAMTPMLYELVMGELAESCADRDILLKAVNVAEKVFGRALSDKEKNRLVPVYNQLVDAAKLPDSRKKH